MLQTLVHDLIFFNKYIGFYIFILILLQGDIREASGNELDCWSTFPVIDLAPGAWFNRIHIISPGCPWLSIDLQSAESWPKTTFIL